MMMTLYKTGPLSTKIRELVIEKLLQRFEPQITNIINYDSENYQWDESKLDRLAKMVVPLLHERRPAAKAAICSGLDLQASFEPNIVRDHLPDDDREDGQRYSRWEREILSDRRAGYGIGEEQLPQRYPIERPEVRTSRLPTYIGDAEMGPFAPLLIERVPRNRMFKRLLSYCTYRLRNSDQRFLSLHADRLGDYQKPLRVTLYAPLFSGDEEIEVVNFLAQYKRACGDTGISQRIALWVFTFNLKGVALASFETYRNKNVVAVSEVKIRLNRTAMHR